MADLLMVVTMVGFIAVCVLYIRWCDHIIGPDASHTGEDPSSPAAERVEAGA